MTGQCWLNETPKASIRLTNLVKAFMNMTELQHPVVSITCWVDLPSRVPYQHDMGEYTQVITLLDDLAHRLPS